MDDNLISREALLTMVEKYFRKLSQAQWRMLTVGELDAATNATIADMCCEIVQTLGANAVKIVVPIVLRNIRNAQSARRADMVYTPNLENTITETFADALNVPLQTCESADQLTSLVEKEVSLKVNSVLTEVLSSTDLPFRQTFYIPSTISSTTRLSEMGDLVSKILKIHLGGNDLKTKHFSLNSQRDANRENDTYQDTYNEIVKTHFRNFKKKVTQIFLQKDAAFLVVVQHPSGNVQSTPIKLTEEAIDYYLPGSVPESPRPLSISDTWTSLITRCSDFDNIWEDVEEWLRKHSPPWKPLRERKDISQELTRFSRKLAGKIYKNLSGLKTHIPSIPLKRRSSDPVIVGQGKVHVTPEILFVILEDEVAKFIQQLMVSLYMQHLQDGGEVDSELNEKPNPNEEFNLDTMMPEAAVVSSSKTSNSLTVTSASIQIMSPKPEDLEEKQSAICSLHVATHSSGQSKESRRQMLINSLIQSLLMELVERLPQTFKEVLQTKDLEPVIDRLSCKGLIEINPHHLDALQSLPRLKEIIKAVNKDLLKDFSSAKELMKAAMASHSKFDDAVVKYLQIYLAPKKPKKSKWDWDTVMSESTGIGSGKSSVRQTLPSALVHISSTNTEGLEKKKTASCSFGVSTPSSMESRRQMLINSLVRSLMMEVVERLPQKFKEALQTNDIEPIVDRLSRKGSIKIAAHHLEILQSVPKLRQVISAVKMDLLREFKTAKELMEAAMASDSVFDDALFRYLQIHLKPARPRQFGGCRFLKTLGRTLAKPFKLLYLCASKD